MIGSRILSFNSIAIFIGVAGFLSAVVTLFIDVQSQISVQWLLLVILFSLTITSILIKICSDLSKEKNTARRVFEKPIKAISEQQIFITRLNPLFTQNCIVGGYLLDDEVEALAFVGYISHTQENLVQIKTFILIDDITKGINLYDKRTMNKIVIRPVIPFSFLDSLGDSK